MKKSIILILAVLSLSSVNMLSAGGGDAFAGGMAGGMLGGVVSGAMSQPRERTVVVQQPSSDYYRDQNYQLQKENDQLKRNLDALEKRLEKLEGK